MKRVIIFALVVVPLVLAAWIVPYCLPPRAVSSRNACISSLEYLQRLKLEWAAKNQKSGNDIPTEQDLFGTNRLHGMLKCPSGADYRIGAVKEYPVCSRGGPGHSLPERQ